MGDSVTAAEFTVLGAGGFIGGHLAAHLRAAGHRVATPDRAAAPAKVAAGHVIYCIGRTADFRRRPFDTMDAHVSVLLDLLRAGRFRSVLFLSSTRVYGIGGGGREDEPIKVDPNRPDDLYNISKLAGEALCLTDPRPTVRVARLSNVYGAGMPAENFLSQVLDAAAKGCLEIGEAPESSKDYIAVEDVCRALERIARSGAERLYNIASGVNLTHGELAAALARATGTAPRFRAGAATRAFPRVDTTRLSALFTDAPDGPWSPRCLLDDLDALLRRVEPGRQGRRPADSLEPTRSLP